MYNPDLLKSALHKDIVQQFKKFPLGYFFKLKLFTGDVGEMFPTLYGLEFWKPFKSKEKLPNICYFKNTLLGVLSMKLFKKMLRRLDFCVILYV